MIPPGVFIVAVACALLAAGVTLTFDAQHRAKGLVWGTVTGLAAFAVAYLLFLR